MTPNGTFKIIWVDDDESSVSRVRGYLEQESGLPLKIEAFEKPTDGLAAVATATRLNLVIFDLRFPEGESDGLLHARTAIIMKPAVPVVALTEYLPDFSYDIAEDLSKRDLPFLRIWRKQDVAKSPESLASFAREVHMFCQSEYHEGEIARIEADWSEVTLRTPGGGTYTRSFETAFLEACGATKAGQKVGALFWETADGKSGHVHMQLTVTHDRKDLSAAELAQVRSPLDPHKIREKFPSMMSGPSSGMGRATQATVPPGGK